MLFFIFLITTGSHWKNIQYGDKNLLAKFYTQLTCTSCRLAVVKSHAAFLTLTDSHPRISALLPSPYFTSSLSLFASIKLSTLDSRKLEGAWQMHSVFLFILHAYLFLCASLLNICINFAILIIIIYDVHVVYVCFRIYATLPFSLSFSLQFLFRSIQYVFLGEIWRQKTFLLYVRSFSQVQPHEQHLTPRAHRLRPALVNSNCLVSLHTTF